MSDPFIIQSRTVVANSGEQEREGFGDEMPDIKNARTALDNANKPLEVA